jgi:predicted N-acetyltransferase YhbS
MNKNDYIIRLEEKKDYREVENLVRESFWNVYRPGCSEHYVIHVLRDDPAFIPELDFVMEKDGKLIGQNMFMKTVVEADDGRIVDVLTMGPIGITPELTRQGYGKSGFDYASQFGIRYHDLPEGADASFFLCKELKPGFLNDVEGVYQTPKGYYVSDEDVEEFDKDFPPKTKLKLPDQIF